MLEWNKCNQFKVYSWRTWFPFWSINIITNIQWECWDRMRQPCSSRCPTHDGCVEIGWHYHNICWWPNMMVTGMLRWLVGRYNHVSVDGLYTCPPPPPPPRSKSATLVLVHFLCTATFPNGVPYIDFGFWTKSVSPIFSTSEKYTCFTHKQFITVISMCLKQATLQ